jgi:hypothetical protein
LFRIGLSQFIRRIFLVLLGLSWVGYLGYILSNLYRSHGELQSYHREQVLRDSGKRAEALAYFFSERSKDLRTLVSGRELQTYFENKALGMSMQYGLSASLYCIRESFDVFRTESRLGDSEIYQRIVFLNSDGTTIVDSRPEGELLPIRASRLAGLRSWLRGCLPCRPWEMSWFWWPLPVQVEAEPGTSWLGSR